LVVRQCPGRPSATQASARANVEAYAALLSVPLPQRAVETLLAALTAAAERKPKE
jgi:hypothetical protein